MSCLEENGNLSYIGESNRCLENRVKEHNSQVTSAIYKHSISDKHPKPTSPTSRKYTKIENKLPEKLENPLILESTTLPSIITQEMYIPEIPNHFHGADRPSNESNRVVD